MDVSGTTKKNTNHYCFIFPLVSVNSIVPVTSAEATNHDRSKEKPNGSLEETTAVEVPTSPPRTTLLGTIFSPVFNFFSPAKNGKQTIWFMARIMPKPKVCLKCLNHGVYVCLLHQLRYTHLFTASSGSDSPDQALEAEEIVKQLDIEQAVETPTSTATSTQELCAPTNFYSSVSQLPPLRPPHIPEVSPTAGEAELCADADLPPLTGRKTWFRNINPLETDLLHLHCLHDPV